MHPRHSIPRNIQVAAAVVGNALEWFDFIVFGFFAVIIGKTFFPSDNEYSSLLLATATFGVGFFMRPLGGVLLGIYADRHGRKSALLLVVGLMTIATALIGLTPSYASIGLAAPVIILFARLLQGFSAGGEFASATSFLIETAPADRRGLYGSWQMVGQSLAVLIGALIAALLTRILPSEALESWGWRVPFLFGLIIGPVALFIRSHVDETNAFVESRQKPVAKATRLSSVVSHRKEASICLGIAVASTIFFYVLIMYMPTFARTQLALSLDQAFLAQAISLACVTVLIPLFGALSDQVGRKPIMTLALISIVVLVYPMFSWLNGNPSFANLLIAQLTLCGLVAMFAGPLSTALAEQFPVQIRSTGLALGYNTAVMIFGGFAQFFVTWLIHVTGSPAAPSFYVMFGAGVGLLAILFSKEMPSTSLAANQIRGAADAPSG